MSGRSISTVLKSGATDWLPETMSQATFRRDFGGRDGRRYQAVIDEIDRSIDQLPVAQGSNGQ